MRDLELKVARVAIERTPSGTVNASDPGTPGAAKASAPLVLVAEDDPIYGEMAAYTLGDFGFSVVLVADGAQALQHVAARMFDVIIFDINLPNLDGLSAIRALRSMGPNIATPVVVMTGETESGTALDAYKAGVTSFLRKPIDWVAFPKMIAQLLAGSKALAEEKILMDKVRRLASGT